MSGDLPQFGDLAQRAATLRELLRPAAPDPILADAADHLRRQLDPNGYGAMRDYQDGIGRGWTIDGEQRRTATAGGTWEHRHACPDCYSFRGPSSVSCTRCGSTARSIPAHERARASEGTRRRASARRNSKRKRK